MSVISTAFHMNTSRSFDGARGFCLPLDRDDFKDVLRVSLEKLVANAFQVDETLLRGPTRGRAHVARARQVAMYLAHTACGLSLSDVGRLFERDRTTAAHACRLIEDAREDDDFDRAVDLLASGARMMMAHAILPLVMERAQREAAQ